jgi:hypothetical protein
MGNGFELKNTAVGARDTTAYMIATKYATLTG